MNLDKFKVSVKVNPYKFERQNELAIFAADSIMTEKFPNMEKLSFRIFKESDEKSVKFYNEVFTIQSQHNQFISKACLRVSLIRLGANFPKMIDCPYDLFVDEMKEFLNQFSGIINQNISSSVGLEFKVGIPSHENLVTLSNESLSLPGVRIVDKTGTFDLNFGCGRLHGKDEIKLKDHEFCKISGEKELEFF